MAVTEVSSTSDIKKLEKNMKKDKLKANDSFVLKGTTRKFKHIGKMKKQPKGGRN